MSYAVEMRAITKCFGQTVANQDVDLAIKDGHIHAILGENGAGKSTLMRMLFGEEQPDSGSILIHGQETILDSPARAIALGIGLIHQHFMLINEFSIAENFALGTEPTKLGLLADFGPVQVQALRILENLDLPLDLNVPVGLFSVEEQQIIEIGKALYRGADILVLDEPTSVLTPQKIDKLLQTLLALKAEGKTIVLITHKLEEALAVADEISILRNGILVATMPRVDTDKDMLVRLMMGEGSLLEINEQRKPAIDDYVKIEKLSVSMNGRKVVKDISLTIRAGEIFGITGVGGNGQTEFIESLVGLRQVSAGRIQLGDQEIQTWDVRDRRQAGLAYVPEDRMHRGLAPEMSIIDNMIMGHHTSEPVSHGLSLSNRAAQAFTRRMVATYDVLYSRLDAPARSLSGGNLQKIIIAREFSFESRFLIVAYPSQGIDIRTTSFVHSELLRRRNMGCSILLISGDLDEIIRLSDRIGVFYNGELVTVKVPAQTSRIELGQYMTGVCRDESGKVL